MEFWTKDKIQKAIGDCKFINFPDDWSSVGLRIWHADFKYGNMVLVRRNGEKRGVLPNKLPDIIDKVSAIITTNADEFIQYDKPVIEVDINTDDVILMLAKYIRSFYTGKVIDVTGSSGKSTTTKIVYDMLKNNGASANLDKSNTSWGIAWNMTNFNLKDDYWVVETSLGGGIIRNSLLTLPHIAIVTNIAPVHLGANQVLADIATEKSKIFTAMKQGGYAVLYKNMAYYDIVENMAKSKELNIITFGEDNADIIVHCGKENYFEFEGERYFLENNFVSKHIMLDMAAAFAIAHIEKLDKEEVIKGFNEFKSLTGRGETFSGFIPPNMNITVVDESYNANPLSMKAALEGFKLFVQDKSSLLILGDMAEGGTNTVQYHMELEKVIKEVNPKRILFCGQNIKILWKMLKTEYPCEYFETVDDLNKNIFNWIKDDDNIFIKASNSIKLSKTVDLLKKYMTNNLEA